MYYNLGQLKWKSGVDKKTGRQPFGLFSKNFDSLYLPLVKEDFDVLPPRASPLLERLFQGQQSPGGIGGQWQNSEQFRSMHCGPRVQCPRPSLGIGV